MFSENFTEAEINSLIANFESHRKKIFDLLNKKDLEDKQERNISQQLKVVESISSNLVKLRKLKKDS